MEKTNLNDLVAATGTLATLPGTVVDLLYLLGDSTACAEDVKLIIERDPAMTANILKLGNSAYYGVCREIHSVREALVMLGNRCVAALSFATGMAPVLRRELEGYGIKRQDFWEHSLITGAAASEVVRLSHQEHLCCEAFTAGLVHDVGMLVIDPWLRQNGHSLHAEPGWKGVSKAEMDLLGFDHCRAGAQMAENWGFPETLVETIESHHDPLLDHKAPLLVRAVVAGNLLAEGLGDEDSEARAADLAECLTQLGFAGDLLHKVRNDLTTNLEQTLIRATSNVPAVVNS